MAEPTARTPMSSDGGRRDLDGPDKREDELWAPPRGNWKVQPTIGTLGLTSILLIALLVVLFFGSSQIPKLFRSFGSLRNEYRKGQHKDSTDG